MFKRANRVSRLEKAIIIGFMAGYRNNPRPNPENIVTIKLNESIVSTLTLSQFISTEKNSWLI